MKTLLIFCCHCCCQHTHYRHYESTDYLTVGEFVLLIAAALGALMAYFLLKKIDR